MKILQYITSCTCQHIYGGFKTVEFVRLYGFGAGMDSYDRCMVSTFYFIVVASPARDKCAVFADHLAHS